MADEKSKIVTEATEPDTGPVLSEPEISNDTPIPEPEQATPEIIAPAVEAPGPDKVEKSSEEQAPSPKRRGRPPKANKEQAAAPAHKEAPGKKEKEAPKPDKPKKAEKAAPDD